jgi:hypothetical protein
MLGVTKESRAVTNEREEVADWRGAKQIGNLCDKRNEEHFFLAGFSFF